MKDFNSLPEFIAYFNTPEKCREYLVQKRWGGTPACVYCGCIVTTKPDKRHRWKCGGCGNRFSVTAGSIFQDTKLPLPKFFAAIYLATFHSKGISSVQLGKDLAITQKSAWHVLHRIRELVKQTKPAALKGTVQMDTTWIGGKETNKHRDRKVYPPTPKGIKAEVFGMIEQGGRVYARSVMDSKRKTLIDIVRANVEIGTTIYTDEAHQFKTLSENYTHDVVQHSIKEYQRGPVGTQAIENYWSHLKRFIGGTHHFVSAKHLDRYCDQASWIMNNRQQGIQDRFDCALVRCNSISLTFKALTSGPKHTPA